MKVLMIIPTAFPGTRGSPARVYDMAKVLYERDVDVSIACYYDGKGKPTKMGVYRIPNLPFYRNGIGPSYVRLILDLFLLFKVLQVAWVKKIDILHCHLHEGALIGILVGRLLKKPVIFDIHSSLEMELSEWKFMKKKGLIRKLAIYLDRNLPQWVDYNIALGEKQIGFYKKINEKIKIKRVSNPTDMSFFKPTESPLRRELNLNEHFVIGYQGNMTSLQNLELLVDSAEAIISKCQNVKFLIGFTSDPEEMKRAVNNRKLDTYFIFIPSPYERTPEIINCCDVMVIPRAETYGLPMKLSNYMACGKPIILNDDLAKGAAREPHLIGLYGFKNKTELINRIMELANNKESRIGVIKNTLNFVKSEFSYQSLFFRLEDIYKEVLHERKPEPVTEHR